MVFVDFTVKGEFVKLLPLFERTRGEDICNVFLKFVKECNLPLSKLVAITTDGAPSITDIRCFSRGKTLKRFCCPLDEVRDFLKSSPGQYYQELDEISWLLDLAFLTGITSKLNELNLELQGKDRNISSTISVVNAFQKKLKLWIGHLNKFPFTFSAYEIFSTLEPVTMFISNPFATVDVSELAGESIIGNIKFPRRQISLKPSFATWSNFWTLVDRNKYPMIHSIALKMYSCFGSTYFSSMSIIKNKYRSCLTNSHIDDALRGNSSSYTPDFRKLAANMQCQISHSLLLLLLLLLVVVVVVVVVVLSSRNSRGSSSSSSVWWRPHLHRHQ
ncbi:hypothetical protein B7P43_G16252 [Cryptotermes secundus]|uniref:HAT C-terminal dimerisation domain-containing protein n=1 Tax=Cryptotermes secundus TaxID=105785 RepID=A0A2J7QCZ1_9NEOP|nr:hypothetical protein B7P43_G16252 [Cryptotermes secundus]